MNVAKQIIIIWAIFHLNLAFALDEQKPPAKTISDSTMDIIDPPNTAALNIMVSALSSLKELRKQNKASAENIKQLVDIKFVPNIAIDVSTKLALKKHWHRLSTEQKSVFQAYIKQSLIQDYGGILGSYDALNSINITVDPNVKRKDNKAIVKLRVVLDDNAKPINITLKMIRTNHWRIYDVVFSGVSLIKNYAAQFNSHIRRKGMDSLIEKTIKKLSKLNK